MFFTLDRPQFITIEDGVAIAERLIYKVHTVN